MITKTSLLFKSKYYSTIIHLLITFGVLALYIRLFYGVDLTDESFYSSLASLFARGYRPYLDEILVVQSFAILLKPLAQLVYLVSPTGEGIVLFFRHIYFFSLCASWYLAYRYLRSKIPAAEAALFCFIPLSFWPFAIPSLSYNTMASLFLNTGIIILLFISERKRSSYLFPLSFLFFSIAVFCYPTLIISVLLILLLFWYTNNFIHVPRNAFILTLIYLGLCLLLGFYLAFVHIGLPRLLEMFRYTSSYSVQGGGLEKFSKLANQIVENVHYIGFIVASIWLVVLSVKRFIFFSIAILIAFLYFLWNFPFQFPTIPPFHAVMIALIFSGIPYSLRKLLSRQVVFTDTLGILALLTGSMFAWTSSNGLPNFPVGATIGLMSLALFCYAKFTLEMKLARLVLVVLITYLGIFQTRLIFRSLSGDDYHYPNLNTRIESGPYAGLITNSGKAEFIKEFSQDLAEIKNSTKTIAFFESFIFGYLFTDIKISAPTIWPYSLSQFNYNRQFIVDYYEKPEQRPDIIFWMKSIPVSHNFTYQLEHNKPDPIKETLLPLYEMTKNRQHYIIYRKKY